MNTRRDLMAGLGAATLGGMVVRPTAWPNVTLYTHEGQAITFYDDLIRGKVVAINMMYADREGIRPVTTSNLVRVQALLGARGAGPLHVFAHVAARTRHTATPQGVRGTAWRPARLGLFDGGAPTSSSCAIAWAFSIPIRWSTVTKRRTPAWSALATTGTTAGLRRRRWPRQSRLWQRSTMWPAPARAAAPRVAEAPGPGPGAPSAAAVQNNGTWQRDPYGPPAHCRA